MKILNIRLKNLNSLRGEWNIDLRNEAYRSYGIFAVTGQTGAGKTTIFDAVCLALYGRTPRLSRINASENEIMSRGTGECFSHVTFSTEAGVFLCKWWQTRAGGRASGNLQEFHHHIERYEEGQSEGSTIADKHTETVDVVEKLTGMEFRQFTQSVLLAQGEFDAFLNGSSTERAKILEILTGTEIYSEISKKIATHTESAKAERDKAKLERDSATPRDGLGSDEDIAQSIAVTRTALSGSEGEHDRLRRAVEWLKVIRGINGEISGCLSAIDTQRKKIESFVAERERLEKGIRARDIFSVYTALSEKRKQYAAENSRCNSMRREIEEDSRKLARIESGIIPEYESRLKRITANIHEGQSPESIRSSVNAGIDDFVRVYRQKSGYESERTKLEEALKKAQAKLDSAKKDEDNARKDLEVSRNRVSQLLSMRVSAVLEGERRRLKPGNICPLCGSVVHSEALQSVSGNNTNEDFRFDDELKSARNNENEALRKSQEASDRTSRVQSDRDNFSTNLANCRKSINDCEERRLEIKSSILEIIEPLGILGAKSCDEIRSRVEKWYSETVSLNKTITEQRSEAQSLRGGAEAKNKLLEAGISALSVISGELEELEGKFTAELEGKNFADEKEFRMSVLNDTELSRLQLTAKAHDDRIMELQSVLEDRKKRLQEEMAKAVSDMTVEEAEPLFSEKEKEIDALRRKLITLEAAAESRKKLKSEYDRLDEKFKLQESIYNNWSAFNEELGAKNGWKFGSFAQLVTLKILVRLANVQLEKISSRYTLMVKPENKDKLSLSVIDHEQAGEIRPTKNLSGGERFIVSLALALGLSQIAGSKARVDSLFIDEGFGSLDDEALSAALEALGEIRRDGRMIGIISHVSGISEHITTKISVIRKSEGTSILEGPGCSGGR